MTYEIAATAGLLGISFILVFLAINLDKKTWGNVQFLLIFISMIVMITSVQVNALFLREQGGNYVNIAGMFDALYYALIMVMITVTGFMVLRGLALSGLMLYLPGQSHKKKPHDYQYMTKE